MHAGFFAMRGNMPFDLSRDAPLSPTPADVQADIERMLALWAECRAAATETGPFLFGGATLADAFFAPIAVRLRTYQVNCRQRTKPTSKRSTNGQPSRPGKRQVWRRSGSETSTRSRRRHPR